MHAVLVFLIPLSAMTGLFFAWYFYREIMRSEKGEARTEEIAGFVRDGAYAYLRRQYSVVGLVFAVLALMLFFLSASGLQSPLVPIAFLSGGFFSAFSGYLGMKTATNASSRTVQASRTSLNKALKIAFRSGAVMGLVVVGLGLLYVFSWYIFLDYAVYSKKNLADGLSFLGMDFVQKGMSAEGRLSAITTTMLTFGMGASTQALFARVGGGIFTKGADMAADLSGKIEAGIPEDDPRNPAVIADNVGDNVGDVAGMGADLYESYCGSILAAAALGGAIPASSSFGGEKAVLAPMIVSALGILFSVAGIFAVRTGEDSRMSSLLRSLNIGITLSSVLLVASVIALAVFDFFSWGVCAAALCGIVIGIIIGKTTEYYTSDDFEPTKRIARMAKIGPSSVIIEGLSSGMISSAVPVISVAAGTIAAFSLAGGYRDISSGLYGIAFAAVGMLSTLGITLATDAYGPVADNAGGNVQMSSLPSEVRERTDALDMLGNTTAATGKGFAIGSAALTAMALMSAYLEEVRVLVSSAASGVKGYFDAGSTRFVSGFPETFSFGDIDFSAITAVKSVFAGVAEYVTAFDISVLNPSFIAGMFIGSVTVFIFSGVCLKSAGRVASIIVEEVRRQFNADPGIIEGKNLPDYSKCVQIATSGAQRQMILPALLSVAIPAVIGFLLGVAGTVGLLAGSISTGFVVACMLNNSGGAWDNAKKYIEKGNIGGKLSDAHIAAVIGDMVGDPFKDTAGPSLNILIKLMSMVAIVMCGAVLKIHPMLVKFFEGILK